MVKWNVYALQGEPLEAGFEVNQQTEDVEAETAAISVAVVKGLTHPKFLMELEEIAVVPTPASG